MRPFRPLVSLWLLGLVVAACSSGGSGTADTTSATGADSASPLTTAPFEVVVVDDVVRVRSTGIVTSDGAELVSFTPEERACVAERVETVADLSATLQSGAVSPEDPDQEQLLAEIVVGCVPYDRLQPVAADQLAARTAAVSVERACLDREVASLQDTPDVLAAVLRGDPDALSVIAATAAANCP